MTAFHQHNMTQHTYMYLDVPHASAPIEVSSCFVDVPHEAGGRRAQHLTDVVDLVKLASAGKEGPSQEQLCQDTTEGPHVNSLIKRLTEYYLRGSVSMKRVYCLLSKIST